MPNKETPTAKGLQREGVAVAYVAATHPTSYYPFARRVNKFGKRSQGTRTKLGITQFWASLFEANETLPTKKKLTDTQIRDRIYEQFPDRDAVKKLFSEGRDKVTVNYYRNLYNSGRLVGKVPEIPSFRYNANGQRIEPKRGRRPLTRTEIAQTKKDQKTRYKAYQTALDAIPPVE